MLDKDNALRMEDVRKMRAVLEQNDVEPSDDGHYHRCYAHPSAIEGLRKETEQEKWMLAMEYLAPGGNLRGEVGIFEGLRFVRRNWIEPGHVYFLGADDRGYFFDTFSGAYGMRHNSYIPEARDPRWAEYYKLIDNGRV